MKNFDFALSEVDDFVAAAAEQAAHNGRRSKRPCLDFRVHLRSSSHTICQCGWPKSAHDFGPAMAGSEHFVGSAHLTPKWTLEETGESEQPKRFWELRNG